MFTPIASLGLNTKYSILNINKQKKPILFLRMGFFCLLDYAPNCTRLKAVTVNPLDTESKN